jgi:hypothetical protein
LFEGRLKYISEEETRGFMMLGIKEWKETQGSWISFVGSDDILCANTFSDFINLQNK